jgi:hypothetical protein
VKSFFPFLGTIVIFSAALLYVVYLSRWVAVAPSFSLEIVLLLAITTLVIYFYLLNWIQKNPSLFAQFYLLSIAVKLLAYGAFVAVMVSFEPDQAIENTLLFLITYLLFTFLEVFFLFQKVKQ